MTASTQNGAAPPDWVQWPVERAVARRVRLVNALLRKHVLKLGLQPFRAPDATLRYSPEQVARIEAHLAELAQDDEDEQAAHGGEAKDVVTGQAIALLKQAHAHNEKLMQLVTGPMSSMLASFDAHNERIEARLDKLESGRDAAQDARDRAQDAAHERERSVRVLDAQMERRSKLFDMVGARLPGVFDAVEKSVLGNDPRMKATMGATVDFLKALDVVQLQALLAPEVTILSPDQQAKLRTLLKSLGHEVPGETQPEKKAGT